VSFVATVTTVTIGVGPGWIRARNPAGFEAGQDAIDTECWAALLWAALHSVSIAPRPASKPAGFLALIHPGPTPIVMVVTVATKLTV
jgi:hypothetical protein